MVLRVSAEFESPELAEIALKRIKESTGDVYSTGLMYNKISDRAEMLRHGSIYTLIPTVSTVHSCNYLTAVMEHPASEDIIPEPSRRRNTQIYVICDSEKSENVSGLLNAMGALNIRQSQ